jgi:hypothetical protein
MESRITSATCSWFDGDEGFRTPKNNRQRELANPRQDFLLQKGAIELLEWESLFQYQKFRGYLLIRLSFSPHAKQRF